MSLNDLLGVTVAPHVAAPDSIPPPRAVRQIRQVDEVQRGSIPSGYPQDSCERDSQQRIRHREKEAAMQVLSAKEQVVPRGVDGEHDTDQDERLSRKGLQRTAEQSEGRRDEWRSSLRQPRTTPTAARTVSGRKAQRSVV